MIIFINQKVTQINYIDKNKKHFEHLNEKMEDFFGFL